MKQQLPRKINLEFTCDSDHCEYGDRKCITSDAVTGTTILCPNLNAHIPLAKPQTCQQQAEEAYKKLEAKP